MKCAPRIEAHALITWLSAPHIQGAKVKSSVWSSTWVNYIQEGLTTEMQRLEFWRNTLPLERIDGLKVRVERNTLGKHLAGKGERSTAGHEVRTFILRSAETAEPTQQAQGDMVMSNEDTMRRMIREELQAALRAHQGTASPTTSPTASPTTSTQLDATSANKLIETMYQANVQITLHQLQTLQALLNRTLTSNERLQSQNLNLVASQFNVEPSFVDKALEFISDHRDQLDLATGALAADNNSPEGLRKALAVSNVMLNALVPESDDDAHEAVI